MIIIIVILWNKDWFCPFYKVIDEDELMTTEHNTIFQVSDIVTATEHSDLKSSNAD